VQRLEQLNAGGHGRTAGVERVATIVTDDGLALDGAILREVGKADDAALLFEVRGDLARDLAAIERLAAVLRDGAQRIRVVLVDETIARMRNLATRQENLRRLRILLEEAAALGNGGRERFV